MSTYHKKMRIIVAISGASGVQYGLRLIDVLSDLGHQVDVVISDGARKVMSYEIDYPFQSILERATAQYDIHDIGAAIASGTHPTNGMIIAPCSMKTLAAIANGFSQNLIHRAADCMLKEERKLVMILRETPLSAVHLKNMLSAKQAGASIMPASPGFYYNPKSVDDLINFVVGKALNLFNIPHNLFKPWDP